MSLRPQYALPLALAAALFGASAAMAQTAVTPPETTKANSPMTETDVRAAMTAQGYTGINDVEFKEGVWTADAKSADGEHVEVKVDAAGKVIPDEHVATISKDQIIIKVQDAGYTNVHDVEMEGGVWKAEANDSAGADVEIKLDPDDGHILGSEKDEIGGKKH
jgi:membrane protein implicated in regulation of membrane protease activity